MAARARAGERQAKRPGPSSAAANFPHGFLDLVAYDPKVVARGLKRARRSDGAGCGPLFPSAASSGPLQATTFQCDQCSALFDTHQKLAAHAFSAHGRHTEAEQFLGSSFCACCLMQFWNKARLRRHLTHDCPACLRALQDHNLARPNSVLSGDITYTYRGIGIHTYVYIKTYTYTY